MWRGVWRRNRATSRHFLQQAYSRTNIIIKPRPLIYKFSPDWMNWFRSAAQLHENVFVVEDDASNIMPYLKNADLLLYDASSVVFQYLAMDRPTVLINNPDHRQSDYYDEKGIEWKWRDMAVEVSDVVKLQAVIEDSLANPVALKDKREAYADKLFGELRKGETGLNIKARLDALYVKEQA